MNLGLYQRIRRTDRISPLFRISGYSVKYMITYNADSGKTTNMIYIYKNFNYDLLSKVEKKMMDKLVFR